MSDRIDEAERSVLGGMLLDATVIEDITDVITGRDFYRPVHETIFDTITGMHRARQPVDAITVADTLGGDLDRVGGPAYLHQLIQFVPTAANAGFYAQIVAEAGTKRRLRSAGMQVQELAEKPGDAAPLVEDARRIIDEVSTRTGGKTVFLGETMDQALGSLLHAPEQIPTPWESVNDILGGLRPGCLYVIGARPSVGKSVVGLQLARALTRRGSVAFASLEMSRDDIWSRVISTDLRIDLARVMNRALTAADWKAVDGSRPHWATVPLAISDTAEVSLTDIRRLARSTHRRYRLAGVVVDYLQLMSPARGDKRPRHEFVADVSRQLKLLAMEMHVPVIALSQLNRASEQRLDKMPQLSDLRESGAVEQDADVVILLHREIMGDARNELSLLVAKNRHGRTDTARLQFWGHYSMVLDDGVLPRSEAAYQSTAMGKAA